jgi:superfamily II DNA or RNA helicase
MNLKPLLDKIRESCSAGTWSRGVELARSGAVVGEEDDGNEIAMRVSTKGGLVSPQVVLFPEDLDWTCECHSPEDACAHVAAAAIALKQARDDGKPMPGMDAKQAPGHLAYRLENHDGKLALFRVIVQGDKQQRLDGSLASVALGKIKGPKFQASDGDLQFEKKLGTFGGGVIPKPLMKKVLDALQGVREVTLDGQPAQVGAPVSGLAARVSGTAEGFHVTLEPDPGLDVVFDNGAVRRGSVVHPVGGHDLPEGEFAALRKGKVFAASDVGTLVGDLLPRLRRRLSVIVEADLPEAMIFKPRIQIGTEREGDDLVVLPTIVYGDPAVARVDGDKLTMLRAGEVPLRNERLEKALLERIRGLGFDAGTKDTLPPSTAIGWLARLDDDVALAGEAHQAFFVAGDLDAHLDVRDNGSFDVWFETSSGEKKKADAGAIMAAWERGEEYAPLLGGGFGRIPAGFLGQHGHRLIALLAAREATEGGRAAPVWATADLAALAQTLEQPLPPSFDRLRPLVESFEGLPEPELPSDLVAELREYQKQGVAWLTFLRQAELGALLADDMGLGKTLQTLCAIRGRTLVVAPTSVLHNWAMEIAKFRPSLRASTYHGSGRALDPDADVTLTTYALLRLDADVLSTIAWDTVVLDEAQAIKNPDSQVARAAYRLQAGFRVALTGTPVENRLEDLWSQFHFVNRGLLGGRSDFNERWVRPIASGDAEAAAGLRARIGPFVLRRLKREVASELPPRTDVVLRCELEGEDRAAYDTVRAATQKNVLEQLGGGANVMAMLEALLRLRQAACHRALVPGQSAAASEASPKIRVLLDTLDEAVAEGHKALVFSQWTSLLDLVEPHLRAAGLDHVRLDGSTTDRGAVVERFQSDDGPPVMLISLRAGGVGLNLTAADHVFLLDPWWNPAVEDQAADRAHRIGQDKPVLVHRIVARDTVEERILELQQRKRQLADAALGNAAAAAQITRAELLALLD